MAKTIKYDTIEYKYLHQVLDGESDVVDQLNIFGRDGWELIGNIKIDSAAVFNTSVTMSGYFKRRVGS